MSELNESGNIPDIELWEMSIISNDLRFDIEGGIEPENELDRRFNVWRFGRVKSDIGIGPVNLFSDRSIVTS